MVEKKRKEGRKNLREERGEEKLVQHGYIAYSLHPQYKAQGSMQTQDDPDRRKKINKCKVNVNEFDVTTKTQTITIG